MLFREIVSVYYESDGKHVTTKCGKIAVAINVREIKWCLE